MNKNWPLHFFPRFCCACLEVDKQAHHHPRSKRIKHALTLFMLLCLTGRWFDVNELNQMIPYQLFPLLFYILRKVGAYIFLFKNELLLFFSLHPSIFRTNPWVWMRPEVFLLHPELLQLRCLLRMYCMVITLWHLSFRSYHMFGG